MLRIHQIKLSLEEDLDCLPKKIAIKLHRNESQDFTYRIVKESIDARKGSVLFSYVVDVKIDKEETYLKFKDVSIAPETMYQMPTSGTKEMQGRVIVAGFGPAGMYAAYLLAQKGYQPLVIERGDDVETRVEKVMKFWESGELDETCNVQFGEGGAGTFSDGKLTSRSKDLRSYKVLEEFVRFGAPESILYEANPHIGTDLLRGIVKAMREEIISLGGEVCFASQLRDVKIIDNEIHEIQVNDTWIPCGALLLAIGHSARDTFEMLSKQPITMESKAFAVGVRIEHPQTLINKAQYKEFANHPKLKAAEYRLTYTSENGRGVYTFCMCPGGSVVASASQQGGIVVNGMSEHARDLENANSALLVQVSPDDFGKGILDGVKFQEALEKKAFALGKGNYHAPVQLVKDFLQNKPSTAFGEVKPTYLPGVTLCNLQELFPDFINDSLLEALPAMDRRLRGFGSGDAIMTGVETRSSSPIRILRDQESLQSVSITNLYPCGEGAGYAGGIVSAAIDGIRCAEKIIETYKPK